MASDVRLHGGDKTDEKTFQGEKVKSGLLPGVLIGETKVWRNGKETITEVEGLFPEGLTSVLDSSKELSSSWRVSAWRALSSFTMTFVGLGAKLLLRGFNTTVVHGGEHLEKAINERGNKTALLTVINHQVFTNWFPSERTGPITPTFRAVWTTQGSGARSSLPTLLLTPRS